MLEVLQVIGMVLILIFCIAVIIIGLMYEWSLLATRAPFICLPEDVVNSVIAELDLKDDSVFYDLGCGDGRVLEACAAQNSKCKLAGIDKARVAIWCARWRLRKIKNVKISHKNFFKCDFSDATQIYTYLFPDLMNDLLPKLKRDLKPGTKLVTCDFKFTDWEPERIIDLNRSKDSLGRTLYIYRF
ncbi:MAG: methyltransferase domain-containing protein [Patescibacteria group bacterium]